MIFSKRSLEGTLVLDHRDSPGLSEREAAQARLPGMPVGRGSFFESPTISCSHCQAIVVLNPDRTRSRGYCPKCDAYVCDLCEAERVRTGVCRPFKQVIDEFVDKVEKGIIHG